jgi:site-specific DNA recombinase
MSLDDMMIDPPADVNPRGGPRTRGEIDRDRAALLERTKHQIVRLVAESHARLPREQAKGVGVVYARYSSRFQHSIVDQVRVVLEAATKEGFYIPCENVCFDLAVPGYKDKRPGLNRVRELLAGGGIDVFLVFSTNRLFRKIHKSLTFVEDEVVERGIRCRFVKTGIDSADEKRWRMLLQFHAVADEFVVGMYSDHVRSAHEGLYQEGLVFGTVPFGYRGREIPGQMTKQGRPRRRLEVDPDVSLWVQRAFAWLADDGLSIAEIARRFNADPSIPPSPRGLSGHWSYNSIHYLLKNERYRGWWQYGVKEAVWQSRKDYARQVTRPEPLKATQWDHLRIVSDELWHRAQERLANMPNQAGRKPVDGDRKARPRMLNGYLYCAVHDRSLYVGGAHGKTMFCKDCQAVSVQVRPLFTLLNRRTALKLTCQSLAALIRADGALVTNVIAACRNAAERAQRPDPARIDELRRQDQNVDRQIRFVLDNPGESETDRRESGERLRSLRRSRAEVATELARREADRDRPIVVPTDEEVRALIANLAAVLETAAASNTEGESETVREIVRLLTGGRIELEQQGERKAQRGWLRGRFRPQVISLLATRTAGVPIHGDDLQGAEVVIDYWEPSPFEAWADKVKAAYDRGLMIKEIAAELGITRYMARKALHHWYSSRGLQTPDGRSRRSTLDRKQQAPLKHVAIADAVMALYRENVPLQEIARRLSSHRDLMTKAVAYWHESRGLPVPDGRTRRKTLDRSGARPRRYRSAADDIPPLSA